MRKIGEDARIIQEFVELGTKTRVAAVEARDAEAALGDIPDEFLDPIQVPDDRTMAYQLLFGSLLNCFLSVLLFLGVAVHFNEGSCHFAVVKGDCG